MKKLFALVSAATLIASVLVAMSATTIVATGASGTSLNDCTGVVSFPPRDFKGGIKLYNGDGQSGGDRVTCASREGALYHVDKLFNPKEDILPPGGFVNTDDSWGAFSNKAESFKLRAAADCRTRVWFYDTVSDANNLDHFAKQALDRRGLSTKTKSYEITTANDDTLTVVMIRVDGANC